MTGRVEQADQAATALAAQRTADMAKFLSFDLGPTGRLVGYGLDGAAPDDESMYARRGSRASPTRRDAVRAVFATGAEALRRRVPEGACRLSHTGRGRLAAMVLAE